MNGSKRVSLTCEQCHDTFSLMPADARKRQRKNTHIFCSPQCCAAFKKNRKVDA